MSISSLFKQIDLNTAEELLSQLIPNEEKLLWNRRNQAWYHPWIFRGQMDARWNLDPSAMRTGNLHSFVPECFQYFPLTPEEQLKNEEELMINFVDIVDKQGLEIPGDTPEFREPGLPNNKNKLIDFPLVKHRPMYALAQHYGIPTRFLDWSYDPLVAAYFACVELARQNSHPFKHKGLPCNDDKPKRFAIWAFSAQFSDQIARFWKIGIKLVTVPYCSNPNLCAQKGLFTLVCFQGDGPYLIEEQIYHPEEQLPSIYSLIENLKEPPQTEGWRYEEPVLYKFTLPSSTAGTLLRLLSLHKITAASLFPDHNGAAKALFERNWFQSHASDGRI